MPFLVRSMSTTDARPGNPPQPYHIYLMPEHKRLRAFWCGYGELAEFDTAEAAQAEGERLGLGGFDVVPKDWKAQGLPNYWDRPRA